MTSAVNNIKHRKHINVVVIFNLVLICTFLSSPQNSELCRCNTAMPPKRAAPETSAGRAKRSRLAGDAATATTTAGKTTTETTSKTKNATASKTTNKNMTKTGTGNSSKKTTNTGKRRPPRRLIGTRSGTMLNCRLRKLPAASVGPLFLVQLTWTSIIRFRRGTP